MTTTLIRVLPAREGDAVTIDGRLRHVGRYCDCAAAAFHCLSCHQPLANFCQAELHTTDGGDDRQHTVARDCAIHGLVAL